MSYLRLFALKLLNMSEASPLHFFQFLLIGWFQLQTLIKMLITVPMPEAHDGSGFFIILCPSTTAKISE